MTKSELIKVLASVPDNASVIFEGKGIEIVLYNPQSNCIVLSEGEIDIFPDDRVLRDATAESV